MTASGIQVVLHPQRPPGVEAFLRELPQVTLLTPPDEDGVVRALEAGAQVLATYVWRDTFLRPSLRWIAGLGAGYEQYPLGQLAEANVVLTTAAGVHTGCVAEHAFALMLALTRRLGEAMRNMVGHRWQALPGEELFGKKLAIVGLGRIGEEIARRAQSWGMQVVGVKRNPHQYQGCVGDVRGADRLADVCEWADMVLLAAPASPDRRPLVGERELQRLDRGWIVNVGRGSLIDEAALVRALVSGGLRGAGLDVTAIEPLPADSPLWDLPNVVITAHNAGDSPGYGPRWGAIFMENLSAFNGSSGWVNRVGASAGGAK
ncbi:MAG TPA: D-2-hydroxyacid dehydrogenase [Ramlibacter sp.]|nr:D-2-hydroxyacid dehydrogenase [Ramlibacter sp.]